jgi:hypothetical protein
MWKAAKWMDYLEEIVIRMNPILEVDDYLLGPRF